MGYLSIVGMLDTAQEELELIIRSCSGHLFQKSSRWCCLGPEADVVGLLNNGTSGRGVIKRGEAALSP
jgi:hypothetical protein